MEKIFQKNNFPKAPGGNLYEWKDAEVKFNVQEKRKYLLRIIASAKNAKQNNSQDDDLRLRLDNYEFGKYEIHDEQISWKGFGTASSWDGASLKGGTKTIYFFIELQQGEHILKFFADATPTIQEINIYSISPEEQFQIEELKPPQNISVNKKGVPWLSIVFLAVKPKNFAISATVKSSAQKNTTDGDNLKIIINGKIVHNIKAPSSKKYQNFYFSGDLNQGKNEILTLKPEAFEFLEDSVEFWYDGEPSVYINFELFDNMKEWMGMEMTEKKKLEIYEWALVATVYGLSLAGYRYSSNLLKNSLSDNPKKIIYKNNTNLVKEIKKDPAYEKIISILKNQIKNEFLNGQIILGDEDLGLSVNFESKDLKFSLHGIKKIDYSAIKNNNGIYKINFILFDVYDFDPSPYDSFLSIPINIADTLEIKGILKNFEIEIQIQDSIVIHL